MNILSKYQFIRLLEHVFDQHLFNDHVAPEDVNYDEAMTFLNSEPRMYEVVQSVADMVPGGVAMVMFHPDKDKDAGLGFEVVCLRNDEPGRPWVKVKDYDKVLNCGSVLGGQEAHQFIPEKFQLSRNPKRKTVEWIVRPVPKPIMSQAISVDDWLPMQGQKVLAKGRWLGEITGLEGSPVIETVTYDKGNWMINADTYSAELVDVTHWMPCPEF